MGFGDNIKIKQDVMTLPTGIKFAMIRRDPQTMFVDLKPWIEKNLEDCKEIISMQMCADNGNITIAILFRNEDLDSKQD